MKRLSWRSILHRVEGRRITGLWYGVEDGYVRIELDDGSVLLVASSWERCHPVVTLTTDDHGARVRHRLLREPLRGMAFVAMVDDGGRWSHAGQRTRNAAPSRAEKNFTDGASGGPSPAPRSWHVSVFIEVAMGPKRRDGCSGCGRKTG